MSFSDKTMACQDCGSDFVFTAGEQEFYAEKGFRNEPKRCPDCRRAKKNERGDTGRRKTTTVTCSECGIETQVPFEPKDGRPVYCKDCFDSKKAQV